MPLQKDDPKSIGGYRLAGRLGSGGMGVVYRGRARSGREVAVKVVHAQYAEDAVFRARFRQEIEAVRKVSGAFTAPVVDADPEALRPWMATQYVPGPSLAALIRDQGPLHGTALRRLALGLVEALREIHRAGVVHRDLKPANVLMADDGPRVIDFGISRAAENHHTLTETGQMIGTPPFMSPEQLTDARSVGPASDVFSVGALLVYTSTGRGPFDADSPYLTAYRVVHDAPVLDGVPEPLHALLERCLAKDPTDRPGLDELARELVTALPETGADDQATVPLRTDDAARTGTRPAEAAQAAEDAGPGAQASGGRPGRARRRWAAVGTAGVLALGLTGYLLLGPGFGEDGSRAREDTARSAPSRWTAVPAGWRPWQTTVYATASQGVKEGRGIAEAGTVKGPACEVDEGAVYCAGDGVLPVRLDAVTGQVRWRAGVLPPGTGKGSYSFSVLGVTDDAMLVEQTYTPHLGDDVKVTVAALDVRAGKRLWQRTVNVDVARPYVSGDLVIVPDDNGRSVTARSPRTGAQRWTAPLPEGHYCSPAKTAENRHLDCTPHSVQSDATTLLRLDPADGSARRLTVPSEARLVGTSDGRLVFLEPTDDEQDEAFVKIRLLDPDTGKERATKLAERFEGNPTLADGTLWFATTSGQVTAVSVRTGERLWQTRTSLEQPRALTHDPRARVVYLSSASGRVAALDTGKGTLLWEILPRARRVTSPGWALSGVLLHEGVLVVATEDGDVFTLDPAHPERKPVPG
ncbi:serine/threonine-protein kinase [Streptomyces sp. NPDC019990]|uniref:serine/threonine-protein kinase n=1 Tax=Streptomyces sp. NPDC019990 TaxID=3154693 RepID=UPI0033DFF72E